jgi:HlyD family secretion protein
VTAGGATITVRTPTAGRVLCGIEESALAGHVRLVEAEAFSKASALGVEEQRVNVVVDSVDPSASLGAGYRVEVRIVTVGRLRD